MHEANKRLKILKRVRVIRASRERQIYHFLGILSSALARDEIDIVVQVNGKVRAKISVAADASIEAIEQVALVHDNVQRFTDGVTVRKVIVVPGKLVNVVAN